MMFKQEVVASPSTQTPTSIRRFSPALILGFMPAFRHRDSGEVRLCRGADGQLANQHLFDALPAYWIAERDEDGCSIALVAAVEAGYWRSDGFWRLIDLLHPNLDS
ncbi:hypothetical protein [Chromatium okenii]|jgi:hypothetical protein|uniref:Uncharacterized protein n=1 Tax=Chromatium okenii TaxID=61644 RepID=A0A2S7XPH6_9GAMM|nr:hypothetical protein [Chromatium okenii]PQJ95635.1 hypothetical protein CXB77_16250 [Chromatium okenii]PQJ97554.1 hypothetical protein CXB77_01455 [Chromatium okenii]PQJ97674.1 hypothetical protein CXB77_00160 [Chromatium okenii]